MSVCLNDMLESFVVMILSNQLSNKIQKLLAHQPLEQESWGKMPQKKTKEIVTVTYPSLLVYYEKGIDHQAEAYVTCFL